MFRFALVVVVTGCGFHGHGDTPDPGTTDGSPVEIDAAIDGAIDGAIAIDAPPDAPPDTPPPPAPTNLVLPTNGGVLVMDDGAYCPTSNSVCQPGNWVESNIADGAMATGKKLVAGPNAWCSDYNPMGNPQSYTYSFENGKVATIQRISIQNFGEGSDNWYSTHFRVYGQLAGGQRFVIVEGDLAHQETTMQDFLPAAPMKADRVTLTITSGAQTYYWELGEFEAWGVLEN